MTAHPKKSESEVRDRLVSYFEGMGVYAGTDEPDGIFPVATDKVIDDILSITEALYNKKTPEEVSLPDKVLSLDYIIDKFDIRHPKPSISRNTAKKMLKRDLEALYNQRMEYVIGEDEVEYSNLDGDAGYWEKHGRNGLRAIQRTRAGINKKEDSDE